MVTPELVLTEVCCGNAPIVAETTLTEFGSTIGVPLALTPNVFSAAAAVLAPRSWNQRIVPANGRRRIRVAVLVGRGEGESDPTKAVINWLGQLRVNNSLT